MQRKKAKEKRMSHSLNSHWSKYKLREIPLLILHHSLTQATFIRQRTNFRPAEKFDRTLGSHQPVRTIFIWPWKMVSVSVRYLFYQPTDEGMKRSKDGLFVFPLKKILIWRRHCSIGQSCCSMTSKRSIDWFLESSSDMKFFQPSVCLNNQKPRAFVSVPKNQSNCSISVRLLFLFCSRVFISRSCENRSIIFALFTRNFKRPGV